MPITAQVARLQQNGLNTEAHGCVLDDGTDNRYIELVLPLGADAQAYADANTVTLWNNAEAITADEYNAMVADYQARRAIKNNLNTAVTNLQNVIDNIDGASAQQTQDAIKTLARYQLRTVRLLAHLINSA